MDIAVTKSIGDNGKHLHACCNVNAVTNTTNLGVIQPAVNVLAVSFKYDPIITYTMNSMTEEERIAYLDTFFRVIMKTSILSKATIYEASSWQSCLIVVPPGSKVDSMRVMIPAGGLGVIAKIGLGGLKKVLAEVPSAINEYKTKYLGKRPYFYIYFVATLEEGRGKGLASRIIQDVLEVARARRVPVWIEATTEKSKSVYARQGFKSLGTIILGKGTAGADGMPKKGGEGVNWYPMLWEPEDTAKGDKLQDKPEVKKDQETPGDKSPANEVTSE